MTATDQAGRRREVSRLVTNGYIGIPDIDAHRGNSHRPTREDV